MFHPTEPLLLGLSSGLACLTSCGTVLLPWMSAERRSWRTSATALGGFLGGRLAGYLAFAVPAWALGCLLARRPGIEAKVFAVAHLGLAVALAAYAWPYLWKPAHACGAPRVLALQRRFRPWTPVVLGLFTGLNLCPPFVAALLRVASGTTWLQALAFFLLFFLGTTPWLLPFVATGALRRIPGLKPVSRLVLLLLACYYAYVGVIALARL